MERGVFGIAGFLSISSEMRILWSAPYLSRVSVDLRCLYPSGCVCVCVALSIANECVDIDQI